MQDSRQQQWQHILQMTEQLQRLSADENWQDMMDLSVARQAKLEHFFSVAVADGEADEIAAGIREIIKSDAVLVQESQRQQQTMSDSLKKLSTGKNAVRAYGEVQQH